MIRGFACIVVAALALVGVGSASTARSNEATSQPIEGYWTYHGTDLLLMRTTASGFEGVVVFEAAGALCPTPVGHALLILVGSGLHYTGEQEWINNPGCLAAYADDATIDLSTPNTARACSTNPFHGSPSSACADLVRGCSTGVGTSGGPVCMNTATKSTAARLSAEWSAAAASVTNLTRRLGRRERAPVRTFASRYRSYLTATAALFATLAKDPPDSNFAMVARTSHVSIRMRSAPALGRLLTTFARTASLGGSLAAAIDRATGARLAGDAHSVALQNAAAVAAARSLSAVLTQTPAVARGAARQLAPRSDAGRQLVRQLTTRGFVSRITRSAALLQAFAVGA